MEVINQPNNRQVTIMFSPIKNEVQGFYQQALSDRQRAEMEAEANRRETEKNRILQRIQDGDVAGRLKERIADPFSLVWANARPASIDIILASNNDRSLLCEVAGVLGVEDEWVEFRIAPSDEVDIDTTRLRETDYPRDYDFALVATFKLS